jgi:uncharacterized protein
MMDKHSRPTKAKILFMDTMAGQTIVFNPLAGKGIMVVGKGIERVLDLCNGRRDIRDIAKSVPLSVVTAGRLIKKLADHGAVNVPGYRLPAPLFPDRMMRIWVHITNACNLACSYCYVKRGGQKMSKKTAHAFVESAYRSLAAHPERKYYLSYILAGGEPLTNIPAIKEILEYSDVMTEKTGIFHGAGIISNGTIMNDEIIAMAKRHSVRFSISLDGFGEMNQNRLFKSGKSSFSVILRTIDRLMQAGLQPFILITITPENINGLTGLTRYLLEKKLGFSYSLVKDEKIAARRGYIDTLIRRLNECYDAIEEMLPGCFPASHKFETISLRYLMDRGCSIGRDGMAVSHDGKVYLCHTDIGRRPPVASVKDADILRKIWTQTEYPGLHEYRSVDRYDSCSRCDWRYQCAGACPLFTRRAYGRLNQPSPYCRVFKRIIPRLIRFYALHLMLFQKQKTARYSRR